MNKMNMMQSKDGNIINRIKIIFKFYMICVIDTKRNKNNNINHYHNLKTNKKKTYFCKNCFIFISKITL